MVFIPLFSSSNEHKAIARALPHIRLTHNHKRSWSIRTQNDTENERETRQRDTLRIASLPCARWTYTKLIIHWRYCVYGNHTTCSLMPTSNANYAKATHFGPLNKTRIIVHSQKDVSSNCFVPFFSVLFAVSMFSARSISFLHSLGSCGGGDKNWNLC